MTAAAVPIDQFPGDASADAPSASTPTSRISSCSILADPLLLGGALQGAVPELPPDPRGPRGRPGPSQVQAAAPLAPAPLVEGKVHKDGNQQHACIF